MKSKSDIMIQNWKDVAAEAEARATKAEAEVARLRDGIEAERQYQIKTAELFAGIAMPVAESVALDNAASLAALLESEAES